MRRGAEKIIAGYLDQLTKEPVFNRYDAERYLLLASDLPGYTVRLTLRPAGTAPGEVVGDVTVQHTPAYVDFNVQNGGSQELGRWGGLLRGELFGLTGLGDRTTLSVFSTPDFHEQQTIQLATISGLARRASASATTSPTPGPSRRSPTRRCSPARCSTPSSSAIRSSAARRRRSARSARPGLRQPGRELDGIRLTRDRLRVGFLRLGFDAPGDRLHRAASRRRAAMAFANLLELRQGLHVLGATQIAARLGANCLGPGDVPPSRIEGQSDATVLRYTGYGEFRPVPKLTFALGARLQYAWKPLLSFEEFSAGNYTVGRGYDPGALLGDRGFGTQAEIRFGSRTPRSARSAAVEAYAFWDHALGQQPRQAVRLAARTTSIRSAAARASTSTASRSMPRSQSR